MDGLVAKAGSTASTADTYSAFSYSAAFSRNLGWLTEWEQQALRGKRVAIAGMGGVGGSHLLTLARLGIGAFTIADPDRFELVNFNRQAGAGLDAIGKSKVEVMAEKARQINPELRLTCFDQGVDSDNLDAFLAGADLFVDALDFFVLDMRRKVSARCTELGIPVINAAPLGMGTAFLIFRPGGMTFEEWFRLDGLSEERQYVNYLVGMAPSALHRSYLVDPTRVDLAGHRGPSTVAACELCAGIAGAEAAKLLLGRGRVRAVPYYHQFDAYRGRWISRKLRGGNAHPLQRLKIALTARLAARLSQRAAAPVSAPAPMTEIEKILDLARWAPSGDNIQPWRFEIAGEDRVVVHLTDQAGEDPYDYRDGEPTLFSGGALLESMRIAASAWGRGCDWRYEGRQGHTHRIVVSLPKASGIDVDPLLSYVSLRSVDRRPYRLRRLAAAQKAALAAALGPALDIEWHETLRARWRMARLGAKATAIRLTTPELFPIHRRVIDWENRFSPTGIPAAATGIGRVTLPLMRWAMQSWPRMQFLNRLGGTLTAAVQMDYLPGIFCSGFFTLRTRHRPDADPDRAIALLTAGGAIQRFWLTATRLGLVMQPAMAALIFSDYGERGTAFTASVQGRKAAASLTQALYRILDRETTVLSFMGRIGTARHDKQDRSVRCQVRGLMVTPVRDALLVEGEGRSCAADAPHAVSTKAASMVGMA